MSLCVLTGRHQCIIASAILKYECAFVFVVSLPFCSLCLCRHLRGISSWFCARLLPSYYRGTGSIDSSPRTDAFLSSLWCILPSNHSTLHYLAEPEWLLCVEIYIYTNTHHSHNYIKMRQGKIPHHCETNGLYVVLATKHDRY